MGALDDVPRVTHGPGGPRTPLRTLGLVGDVHAETARLEVALSTLRERGVDRLASVGDLCDGDGSLARTCELLETNDVLTITGNHERWLLADRMRDLPFAHVLAREPDDVARFCRLLPPMLEIATAAGTALLCHGVGRDDMAVIDPRTTDHVARWHTAFVELLAADRFAWMLAGHTHQFMLRRFDHLGIVNAGALCSRGPNDTAGFVRIDFAERVVDHWRFEDGTAEVSEPTRHPLP